MSRPDTTRPHTLAEETGEKQSDGRDSDDTLFVASLAKGLKVLECFEGGKARLSLTEIDARANIGKSAAQRAVHTLFKLGYLGRDESAKRYRLSPKLLSLISSYSFGQDLLEAGLPEMKRCHEETGETVNITERDGTEMVCIARIPGRHAVTIYIGVGWRVPAFATGPGLVALAHEPPDAARRLLEASDRVAYTKQTVTDVDALMRWLTEIRSDGYVIADQLLNEGEYSLAAPIFDSEQKYVASFNISLPVSRWSLHDLRGKMVPLVTETARRITANLAR